MIRNLLDNAINYTPSSAEHPGVITARVLADPFGHVLVLQVEDSGPAFPESERELVFQPFYRALGTNVDGSGLGLPIVLEIARQHNAEIKLEDAHPGHVPPGTRVSVRFVLSDEAVAPARRRRGSGRPCRRSAAAARARSPAPPPAAAAIRCTSAHSAGIALRVVAGEAAPAQQGQRVGVERAEVLAAQIGAGPRPRPCAPSPRSRPASGRTAWR